MNVLSVGIDFGTTNSAVAVAEGGKAPELLRFPGTDGSEPLWRTVLHFLPGQDILAGAPAIARYVSEGGEGRLLQSIKSHLASGAFSRTQIAGRNYTLEQLISVFLRLIRDASPIPLGTRAVVGRPVRYWGSDSDKDETRALKRMREALTLAGFEDVTFEYEPVAAAAAYKSRLSSAETVLVADFGGGTSDFSVIRLDPSGDDDRVLATSGIGIGGDTFDGRIVDHAVSPALGKGTEYVDGMGADAPVPGWLYTRLRRWHHLSFLKEPKTMQLLQTILGGAHEKEAISRLIAMVEEDLGLPLHQSIEGVKRTLSDEEAATFNFTGGGMRLSKDILRDDFEDWIDPDIEQLHRVLDDLFQGDVSADNIDRVFATGGSSFVPAVRMALGHRFGITKLVGGDELTSVAWGLARKAQTR